MQIVHILLPFAGLVCSVSRVIEPNGSWMVVLVFFAPGKHRHHSLLGFRCVEEKEELQASSRSSWVAYFGKSNLLQLGNKPHESFFKLASKYGPLMSVSLGMETTVVISSSTMAKEVLKTHDHILSGRTVTQAAKVLSHYKTSIVFGQYGPHWRMLRRVSNTELFSVKRLEALQHFRRDQVNRMIH